MAEIVTGPDFASPSLDASYHDYWARALVSGNWTPPSGVFDPMIRTTPYFRPPGYPYFLALINLTAGSSYLWPRVIQLAIGLLSCLLAYLLGKSWFGESVGVVFAALMSFYWSFIYFEGELLEPVLLVPLALGLIYLLGLWVNRLTWLRSIGAGVVLGLTALTRPNVLLFIPVVLIWAFWVIKKRKGWYAYRIAALGLVFGLALTIAPATIRNFIVAKEFVLISANGGVNLYLGNNPAADGFTPASPNLNRWSCYDYPNILRGLELELGHKLSYGQASSFFAKEAIKYILAHPGATLRLTWKKALLFWGPMEVGNEKQDELERRSSKILRHIPGRFSWALSLALLGVAILLRDFRTVGDQAPSAGIREHQRDRLVLVALFVGSTFVSYLPFFVAGRYRVIILPFLLLLSAYALCRMGQMAWQKKVRGFAVFLLIFVALFSFVSRNFASYTPDVMIWYCEKGSLFAAVNRLDHASQSYRQALKIAPDFVGARYNLGLVLAKQGKWEEAKVEFVETIRLQPLHFGAQVNLAAAYMALGRTADAIEALRKFASIVPNNPDVHINLGLALVKDGNLDQAIFEFTTAVNLQPNNANAHQRLAEAFYEKGKYIEAWREVRLCKRFGGQPDQVFLTQLFNKMPNPDDRSHP